jgi:hypothetical protein
MNVNMQNYSQTMDLDDVDALGFDDELAMLADAMPALERAYAAHTLHQLLPALADAANSESYGGNALIAHAY